MRRELICKSERSCVPFLIPELKNDGSVDASPSWRYVLSTQTKPEDEAGAKGGNSP
jgi:hypothetical protein